jgi:hypothetical protein
MLHKNHRYDNSAVRAMSMKPDTILGGKSKLEAAWKQFSQCVVLDRI